MSAPVRGSIPVGPIVGACLCLTLTLVLGVALAIEAVWPIRLTLPMERLQPLHTFLAIGFVLCGIASVLDLAVGRGHALRLVRISFWIALVPFLLAGGGSILIGRGSGREYLTWAPILSPLLILFLIGLGVAALRNVATIARRSPEAAWLIGVGLVVMPLGVIEASAYLLPGVALSRDLSFQWHGLDIVVAGWNAVLYGLGILVVGVAKPLRGRWLYLLAALAFVSTFGHHHYLSPQPETIKVIAFIASMIAGVSFLRHARAAIGLIGRPDGRPVPILIRAAELWTLVAIGSGVLLAVPRINLVLHGTYAIVGHAMGAMIGVNVMLILAGLVRLVPLSARASRRVAGWVVLANLALALLWLDLLAAGTVEGVLRFGHPYQGYRPWVERMLLPLPAFGLALAAPLWLICLDVALSALALRARRRGAARQPAPGVAITRRSAPAP